MMKGDSHVTTESTRTIQDNLPAGDRLEETTHQLVQALLAKHGNDYHPLLELAEATTSPELQHRLLEYVLQQSKCFGHLLTIAETPTFPVTHRERAISTLTKWVGRCNDANRLYVRLLAALTADMDTALADELAKRLLRSPTRNPDPTVLATIAERSPTFRSQALDSLRWYSLTDPALPLMLLRVLITHAPAVRQQALEVFCRRRDRLTTQEKVEILAAVAATGDAALIEQAVPIAFTIRWTDQQDFRTELAAVPAFAAALCRGAIAQTPHLAELICIDDVTAFRAFETELAARGAVLIEAGQFAAQDELLRFVDYLPTVANQAFSALVRRWPDVVYLDELRKNERFEDWLHEPANLISYLQLVQDRSGSGFAPLTRLMRQLSRTQRDLIEETLCLRRDADALSLLYDWCVTDGSTIVLTGAISDILEHGVFRAHDFDCLVMIATDCEGDENSVQTSWGPLAKRAVLTQVPVTAQNAYDYADWYQRDGTDPATRQAIWQHVLESPDLELLAADWATLRTSFDNPN
jgi:hypothetical protein